jgi:cation transporter-like permease
MFTLNTFLTFSALLLATNVIAVSAIVLISYAVAILTFKKGLDPDNFVIPIESSLADSITSIALLVALFLVNYLV